MDKELSFSDRSLWWVNSFIGRTIINLITIHMFYFLFINLYVRPLYAFINCVISYEIMDLMTGISHYWSDRSYTQTDKKTIFNQHHLIPHSYNHTNWMDRRYIFGYFILPTYLIFLYFLDIRIAFIILYAQIVETSHTYAHKRTSGELIPKFWLICQNYGIFVSPEHHKKHHIELSCNYCIFSGHMDIILNPFLHIAHMYFPYTDGQTGKIISSN